jgi:alpha-mannosidase
MNFFTLEKIARQLPELRQAIYREIHPIRMLKYYPGDCPGASEAAFDDSGWDDFRIGDEWGGYDRLAWFRARVPIPTHLRGQKLALRFVPGPRDGGESTAECLLFVNGVQLQAIDVWHEQAWLPPELLQEEHIVVALRAWSGVLGVPPRRRFRLAELVCIDDGAEAFYFLAAGLHKAIQALEPNDLRRVKMLEALNGAFLHIDFTRPGSDSFYGSLVEAARRLGAKVETWAAQPEVKPVVKAVGHAHIDLAWLWRLTHSRDKAVRTFTTALHLMRQYAEFRFMHSTPQLYKFLERDDPQLFDRIRQKIASGEWEITGGMWVESDTNVPSGESLVRQFLLGRRYIRERFGLETSLLWLPDVFGYSAALPQIAARSGIKYFLTTKISWNQFNRFPYDTFRWRGIDGTELLTHFVTTPGGDSWLYTYNGPLEPADVKGLWDQYQQKDVNSELLHLFGWGDGGGGPTQEMLETARLLRNLPGLPRVEMEAAEPYFARLAERLANQSLPVWDGELYLEYHRGTYTSQAWNKRANRLAEVLYHNAEWLSTLARLLAGQAYPADELHQGWERLLLNQFHDILPGSSIREVYEDCREDYAMITGIGRLAVEQARNCLQAGVAASEDGLIIYNGLSWPRAGMVSVPLSPEIEGLALAGDRGEPLAIQAVRAAGDLHVLLETPEIPALGYRTVSWVPAAPDAGRRLAVSTEQLENEIFRIRLDELGRITSLLDKRHAREALARGTRANVFQAFEDKPMAFDAWDIDIYYQEKMREVDDLIEAVVEESGPLRGVVRLVWRYLDSVITQRVSIYTGSPRIDFRTDVDWHQQQTLLKVAFPVNVRATRATYDIQFGSVERPTHWNTSWDHARFEAVGHKWVDLSEGNYGVALLNDCKYGHDVRDNVLRLTLIKSAIKPDPQADQGRHTFTYSLLPHAGDWRASVPREAYALNHPLLADRVRANPGGSLPAAYQFVTIDSFHVVVETVKKAEDNEAWIVRLYECQQSRNNCVTLTFGQKIRDAVECNLVEEDPQPVSRSGNTLSFPIAPFEIKTFKVWIQPGA